MSDDRGAGSGKRPRSGLWEAPAETVVIMCAGDPRSPLPASPLRYPFSMYPTPRTVWIIPFSGSESIFFLR